MPKLSPLHWIVLALFQVFYGFAVFALTRDYYLRPRAAPAQAQAQAAAPSAGLMQRLEQPSAIPDELVQKDPRLLAQQGDQYLAQGRYAEAVRVYRRVLELTPDDVDTHNDLGLALYYSGDTAGALRVLKQGVAKAPDGQRIRLTLGFVQMHGPERPQAAETLRQAAALGPDTAAGEEARRFLKSLEQPGG